MVEDYRRHLYEALHAASRDYDQAVLTLSAATLALSVTFLHQIAPHPIEGTRILLFGAWGSLAVAIIAMVISFPVSQHGLRRRIEAPDAGEKLPMTGAEKFTQGLNVLAGIGLVAGLLLLGWFALENI